MTPQTIKQSLAEITAAIARHRKFLSPRSQKEREIVSLERSLLFWTEKEAEYRAEDFHGMIRFAKKKRKQAECDLKYAKEELEKLPIE